MALKRSSILIIMIGISLFSFVFPADKIINNEVINTNHTIFGDEDSENFPDYSILLQIDIIKNSSAYNTNNSDIVIVDDTTIPKTGGININIPTNNHLMRKINFLGRHLNLKPRKYKP